MQRLALAAVAVLFAGIAAAEPPAPDGGAAPAQGVLTKAPELIRQVEAKFPPSMVDAGIGGRVVCEIDIGADGKVLDARVVESAGEEFDAATLEAVRQFEFSPAEVDGVPAPVRILYAYEFLFRPEPPPHASTDPADAGVTEAPINFSGAVLQRGTRMPLEHATVAVLVPEGALEQITDAEGHFQFRGVPDGTWQIAVSAQDHDRFQVEETIAPGRRTEATYYVRRVQYGAYETVVRAERERKEVSIVSLRQEEIRLMPGTQGDALRVVQNLPGVARAPFSAGLLIVRGGKPWDTRVYVDDAPVPQLFHFGGLYATFNSNLLETIDFQPGNFSAEYGRNIGGIVRGRTRTPSKNGVHGYADLNLVDVSALVEAPLGDDWSISVSGRRAHVDAVLPVVLDIFAPDAEDVLNFTVAPQYYDYQVRLERRVADSRDRLSFGLFGSYDRVAFVLKDPGFDPEGRADFESLLAYTRLAFNWDQGLGAGARSRTHVSIGFDQYDFGAGSDLYSRTDVFPVAAKEGLDLKLIEDVLQLTLGADIYVVPYRTDAQFPPRFKLNQIPDPFVSRRLIREEKFSSITSPPPTPRRSGRPPRGSRSSPASASTTTPPWRRAGSTRA